MARGKISEKFDILRTIALKQFYHLHFLYEFRNELLRNKLIKIETLSSSFNLVKIRESNYILIHST